MKGRKLKAVLQPTLIETGPVVAPVGTVVVMLVGVLAVTTAVTPLNFTVLLRGVVLKFVPAMVTVVPTDPLVGEMVEGTKGGREETVLRKTTSEGLLQAATTRSGFPSPSMSPLARSRAFPVGA